MQAAGFRIDENGKKYIRVKGVRWFTNMDVPGRHEEIPLYKKYSAGEYPTYDNYDAIDVSKVADIPVDYMDVNRRMDNGTQVRRVTQLALHRGPSIDFAGYYQRHVT